MNSPRIRSLLPVVVTGLFLVCGNALAQAWPAKPLRIVVPYLAGSFTDVAARRMAVELTEPLGQPVVVENRTGASGIIGIDAVAKSQADGYTLLFTENTFTVNPALFPKLPYQPLKDFVPVALLAEAPTVMWARVDLPAANARALVQLAQQKPDGLTFGSGGQGTSSHLAAALFFDKAKIRVTHIPYKGVAGSIAEAVAGRIDFGTSSLASAMGHIKGGRLRALGVTGQQRSAFLPDAPTFYEQGFTDYDAPIWFGLLAPVGTPPQVVARLQTELAKIMEKPAVRELFNAQGARVLSVTSQEFTARMTREIQQWTDLVARTAIKVE
jgi:tripartite-type tricarboxylate transporter receptor subunit TctC